MNILLIEDHPIFRFGTRHLLAERWPNAGIREAASLADALRLLPGQAWSVIIADLNLPDTDGLELVPKLLRAAAGARLLVLSLHDEPTFALRALELGALGYVTKDRAADELIAAVQAVMEGRRYIGPALAQVLAERVLDSRPEQPHESLSPQEYRVLLQLAAGDAVGEIAERMHLSPKTVSTYRSRILDKLGGSSNVDLARYCLRHGLLADD